MFAKLSQTFDNIRLVKKDFQPRVRSALQSCACVFVTCHALKLLRQRFWLIANDIALLHAVHALSRLCKEFFLVAPDGASE